MWYEIDTDHQNIWAFLAKKENSVIFSRHDRRANFGLGRWVRGCIDLIPINLNLKNTYLWDGNH